MPCASTKNSPASRIVQTLPIVRRNAGCCGTSISVNTVAHVREFKNNDFLVVSTAFTCAQHSTYNLLLANLSCPFPVQEHLSVQLATCSSNTSSIIAMPYFSAFARVGGPTTPQSLARRQSSSSSSKSSSTTPELDRLLDRQTMSPMNRTQNWLEGPSPNTTQNTPDLHKVRGGRVVKDNGQNGKDKRKSFWGLQLLSSLFGQEQDENGDDELEGDTIVEDEDPNRAIELDNEITLVEDNEEVIEAEQGRLPFEMQSDQGLSYNDSRIQQRTNEEIWLFNKLSRLGREPLLPCSWNMDFPTFPAYLFSSDPSRVFVNNTHTTISHGKHPAHPHHSKRPS